MKTLLPPNRPLRGMPWTAASTADSSSVADVDPGADAWLALRARGRALDFLAFLVFFALDVFALAFLVVLLLLEVALGLGELAFRAVFFLAGLALVFFLVELPGALLVRVFAGARVRARVGLRRRGAGAGPSTGNPGQ